MSTYLMVQVICVVLLVSWSIRLSMNSTAYETYQWGNINLRHSDANKLLKKILTPSSLQQGTKWHVLL